MSRWTDCLSIIKRRFSFAFGRPVRVLVVDDDGAVREFTERVLMEAGYVIASAPDGLSALRKCENSEPFDVLLTDFSMPSMDGAELAQRVRSAEPGVKVLYITGYSDALFTKKSTLWDDEAFLEKPCSPNSLLEAVSLLLHGHVSAQKTVWG